MEKEEYFWHLRTTAETLQELSSSQETGLNHQEAQQRLMQTGLNTIVSETSFKWLSVLLAKFNSLLIFILFGAAIIALLTHEIIEFVIILIIIFLTVFLGFLQEYKADRTMKALGKLTAKKVIILRDGKKRELDAQQLVPGDIVFLKRGDIVPADIRLLTVSGLQVIESNITGESKERIKITQHLANEHISLGDMDNMVFNSTHVLSGSGMGVVVRTGFDTVIGKISSSLEHIQPEKSPIQKKIDLLSKKISYIVLTIAVLLFMVLLFQGTNLFASLILVGAVAIAGIPESFPLALTLTFSHGIKKMAKKNALVKDLNSVETLGTTTVICTDKTGTLTENNMRVTKTYLSNDSTYSMTGTGYEPVNTFFLGEDEIDESDVLIPQEFLKAMVLCNDSFLEKQNEEWVVNGEPTEGALLAFAKSVAVDEEVYREDNKRIHLLPFDSQRKYMLSVHYHIDNSSELNFYLKGAGEIVLDKCTLYRDRTNTIVSLSSEKKQFFHDKIKSYNAQGLRVLSIATKSLSADQDNALQAKDHLEGNYIFEGFVGIEDPIRQEVYEAVEQCHKAGIKTVMITGDHSIIAQEIASRLKLFAASAKRIVEGYELDRLSDKELDEIIGDVAVFARATPEHKLRIVNSFQRSGEIVAMTGDGVNDAPALKKADIGIAMGKQGTEVAREAANMILTDDNFATIVQAVQEGRTVYSNIRRFIFYLLTGNFTEISMIFLSVFFGLSLPLSALMILFVNLVTSTIPALALSIEPTHDKVMSQQPRRPQERLLSSYILIKILVLVPFLLAGTLGLFSWELFIASGSLPKAMTFAFVTIIMFELFHSFNARSLHTTIFDKKFFKNPSLFVAVLFSFVLTLLAVYLPVGQKIFGTVPLLFSEWIIITLISVSVVLFSELFKLSTRSEFQEQSNLQGLNLKLE
ncbi:cation-transporting P-type ATPase [Candidatus Woesearchaeota archaeon]|nr:cation-transporting P-type ATPase [Candidatus Woesearchaeota archaeon]